MRKGARETMRAHRQPSISAPPPTHQESGAAHAPGDMVEVIFHLQRTAGNAAVSNLLAQRALTVVQPKGGKKNATRTNAWSALLVQNGVDPAIAVVLSALSESGRSIVEVQALATLVGGARTASDLVQLARAQPPLSMGTITKLAVLPGRGIAYLKELGKEVIPEGRTLDNLVELADPGLGLYVPEVVALAGIAGRDITYLKLLAPAVARGRNGAVTVPVLAALAAINLGLAANEVIDLADNGWTGGGMAPLIADGATARALAGLAALGRKPDQIAALKALGLTTAEVLVIAAIANRDIDYLKRLAPIVVSTRGARTAADLAALAAQPLDLATTEIEKLAAIAGRDTAYLTLLAPAVVAGRGHNRLVEEICAYADTALLLTAADIVALTAAPPHGLAVGYTKDKTISLIKELPGIIGAQIVQVTTWLGQLGVDETLNLLKVLRADGATSPKIHAMMQVFNTAAMLGNAIKAQISTMRGNLDLAARDITEPKTNALAAGTRTLTGPMIHDQVTSKMGPGGAGAGALMHYPTGEDPATISENDLWEDCRSDVILNHPGVPAIPETPAEKQIRQRLALNELMTNLGLQGDIVQQIFAHDEGKSARAVLAPSGEDALGSAQGAHTEDRHVLNGSGMIGDEDDLALRALGHKPGAYSPVVGAFTTAGGAQTAMQAALTSLASPGANWRWMRAELTRGNTVQQDVGGVAGNGTVARSVSGGAVPTANLPPYFGGAGTRPLHTRDDYVTRVHGYWAQYAGDGQWYLKKGNGQWVTPYVPFVGFAPGAKLANLNDAPTRVHLRIIPDNVTGGWFIHSAYPKP